MSKIESVINALEILVNPTDEEMEHLPEISGYEAEIILKEIERLNNIIKHTDSWIDRTIEVIKQQPSEDDTWILERLNGIKQCLQGSDKEC